MDYMTLADYYQQSPVELVKGIVQQIRWKSTLFDALSFATTGTLAVKNIRESGADDDEVLWVDIGEELKSGTTTKPEEVQSRMFKFGRNIDTPVELVQDKTPKLYDPRQRDTERTIDKMIRQFSDVLINNTNAVNPKAPLGLKQWIKTYQPAQESVAVANGLDLSPTGASYSSNNLLFWRALDKLYDMVDGGATHLLCNDQFIRCAKALQRESGMLSTTQDALGREIVSYGGMKFVDVGRKSKAVGTRIIKTYEDVNGDDGTENSDHYTSIYAVRMDKEHFQPIQMAPLEAKDWGILPGTEYYRTSVKWNIGYMITDSMSVARMYGFKME
jgi:hypothetical protein